MKLADLKSGPDGTIVVYAALNTTKYAFDANRENPEDCRWIVETGDDGRPIRYARSSSRWSLQTRLDQRGTLVKLTRQSPPNDLYPAGRTDEQYATLAQILGPYEETAAARREIIEQERKAKIAALERKRMADDRLNRAIDRLRDVGVEVLRGQQRYSGKIELSIENIETLLDEIERLRAQAAEDQAAMDLYIGQSDAEGE